MRATEALEQGKTLVIEINEDNRRVIAALFQINDQWAFADIGWNTPMNTGHPFHLVNGELTGEGPWQIGRYQIEEIGREDPLWQESQEWAVIARETGATIEKARENAKREFMPGCNID